MKNVMIFLIFMMITISSFGQNSAINDNTALIKEKFPKIHNVIVNEAKAAFYGDYTSQKEMIDLQCLAFSIYVILMYIDPPEIPKDVLTNIQVNATQNCCKNCIIDESCLKLVDVFQKADCMLSYMIIDWVKVITEINDQIKAYKAVNKEI
jgi:hypothetical protein